MKNGIKKKNLAIVFGITKDYAFALANVLVGIKKHQKNVFWDDIVIYHDGLSEIDKNALNSILRCDFREFNVSELDAYNINEDTIRNYSLMALARFKCFDLLDDYKKIIWHDADILIQADFSGLLGYGEKSGFAATMSDCNFLVESNFYEPIDGYRMYDVLYNSGIMVLSDKLKGYENLSAWCFQKTQELADKIRYIDQGTVNLLIQEFNIDVERIDILMYCCHPERPQCKTASIVHAYGTTKFWNSDKLASQFPEWQENNILWQNKKREFLSDAKDKVSVIMSVYERVDFLRESIESILNQTYQNFEIIVVVEYTEKQNDINKLIKSYKNQKIQIINNTKRLGFAASLNVAIENCGGKFIARMDDDDISLAERFEKQVQFMNDNPDIGICGTHIKCFGNSNDVWSYTPVDPEECKIQLLFCTSLYHPTVMMRSDVIKKNKLYYDPEYFTEDYELWSRAIRFTKLANIPEILLRYRTSGQNITSNNSEKVHASHLNVMKSQFTKYLHLDLSYDELQIVNKRIDIVKMVYNEVAATNLRHRVYSKILKSNEEYVAYDRHTLRKYLNREELRDARTFESKAKQVIKKASKFLLKPLVHRLNDMQNHIYYIDGHLAALDEKINKLLPADDK